MDRLGDQEQNVKNKYKEKHIIYIYIYKRKKMHKPLHFLQLVKYIQNQKKENTNANINNL